MQRACVFLRENLELDEVINEHPVLLYAEKERCLDGFFLPC
jgi:hypothetical protein